MKRIAALLLLALSACGSGIFSGLYDEDLGLVVVKDLDDWAGAPSWALEWTDFADHYRAWLDDEALVGRDEDLGTRLAVHALVNVLRLADGDRTAEGSPLPAGAVPGWYVHGSDTLDPFTPIPPAEAVWIDGRGRRYLVKIEAPWTRPHVEAAIERIHDAIGRDNLFRLEE